MIAKALIGTVALTYTGNAMKKLADVSSWTPDAEAAGALYNFPVPVILAVIARESSGKADVIGDNGKAVGLMQMHGIAWDDVAQWDPGVFSAFAYPDLKRNPRVQVDTGTACLQVLAGTAYLALLRQRAGGDLWRAIDGYNRGASKATGLSDYTLDVLAMAGVAFVSRGFKA